MRYENRALAATFRLVFVAFAAGAGCDPTLGGTSTSSSSSWMEPSKEALASVERVRTMLPQPVAITRVRREGAWLVPPPPDGAKARTNVRLAVSASEGFVLEQPTSGASIHVTPRGAGGAPAEFADGFVVYRGAGPDGLDILHRASSEGTEDFVVIGSPSESAALDYDVSLGKGIAGLRLVERTLEFLDPSGVPQLRVAPPYVVDAKGVRRDAWLEVQGCDYDADPRGPWGRQVKDPGSQDCHVRVRWNGEGLDYPAVVDPYWGGATSMITPRYAHTAHLLPSGQVLVFGGITTGSVYTKTAELYDPASYTWSPAQGLGTSLAGYTATTLPSGEVLVVGGHDSTDLASAPTTATQIYQWASGNWSPSASLSVPRTWHLAALLPSGKLLVFGGAAPIAPNTYSTSAEIYDGTTWTNAASATFGHAGGRASVLHSGDVLFTGGYGVVSSHKGVQLYHPGTNTWTTQASMLVARAAHEQVVLPSGKVLVVGSTLTQEVYDPAANTWSAIPAPAPTANKFQDNGITLALLPSGGALMVGGLQASSQQMKDAWIFDEKISNWVSAGNALLSRGTPTLTILPTGDALIAGGTVSTNIQTWDVDASFYTEIFKGDVLGVSCTSGTTCAGGLACIDGFCCESSCGGCSVCAFALGASADGVCTPLPAGHPGHPLCGPFTCNGVDKDCPTHCDTDGACSSASHCDVVAGACVPDLDVGQGCSSNSQCLSGFCVDDTCCTTACLGNCQACAAARKASGSGDGICGDAKPGTDPHETCPDEGADACQRDGFCDGLGACRLQAAGTPCANAACVNNAPTSFQCNGAGTCLASSAPGCGSNACVAGICPSSCSTSADCVKTAYCKDGACTPRLPLGEACTLAEACLSGLCVDGFCCNAPCQGSCEACAEPGKEGTCLPVSGEPRGNRPTCAEATADDLCASRKCDGVERETCVGFVGPEVTCRPASCTEGVGTFPAACAGVGVCPALQTKPCAPFGCGHDACNTACAADDDCALGFGCDKATSKCVSAAVCDAEGTKIIQGGVPGAIDCAPYRCEEGACKVTCVSVGDCVSPYACDPDGHCVARPEQTSKLGGCSFKETNTRSNGMWTVLLSALGMAALRRARSEKRGAKR